jgi:hypothetical protein
MTNENTMHSSIDHSIILFAAYVRAEKKNVNATPMAVQK